MRREKRDPMTHEIVEQLNDRLDRAWPEEIIRWAVGTFGADVAASSSFQTQSVPLLHIIGRTYPELPILFVDTGYHFPQTLQFRNEIQHMWGLNVHTVGPILTGPCYPAPCDPDRCCHLRKVEPMQRALRRYRAWITGIRRDQTVHRRCTRVLEPQPGGLLKINPLVNWTREDVEAYVLQHNLPKHPLFEQGFRSVGCAPCTQPVVTGEDDRAGRWADIEKTECGLHWEQGRIEPQENRACPKQSIWTAQAVRIGG